MMFEHDPWVSITIDLAHDVPMSKGILVVDITMQHTVSGEEDGDASSTNK